MLTKKDAVACALIDLNFNLKYWGKLQGTGILAFGLRANYSRKELDVRYCHTQAPNIFVMV
ncbi:MAG: hypothetical protein WCO51_04370 [bacterium]